MENKSFIWLDSDAEEVDCLLKKCGKRCTLLITLRSVQGEIEFPENNITRCILSETGISIEKICRYWKDIEKSTDTRTDEAIAVIQLRKKQGFVISLFAPRHENDSWSVHAKQIGSLLPIGKNLDYLL